MSSDTATLLRKLRRKGLTVEMGGAGHWLIRRDGELIASISATPVKGMSRALANARSNLRKAGVNV